MKFAPLLLTAFLCGCTAQGPLKSLESSLQKVGLTAPSEYTPPPPLFEGDPREADHSLVFPSMAQLPQGEILAADLRMVADVDLTEAAQAHLWQLNPHPLPYSGDLPVVTHRRVEKLIAYYTGNGRRTFRVWLERSGRYLPMMRRIFAEAGLPEDLTYLAMIESGFNQKAYSWARAAGPWQFIESTGRMYGLKNTWWMDERRDPEKATRAAAKMLANLHKKFKGDWLLAAAAYNAGPGRVAQAIRKTGSRDFWVLTESRYLREETKNYVPKLMAALHIARNPEKYGFKDLKLQQPLEYDVVRLPSTTDLEVVARLTGMPYKEVKTLNAELKRWCTPPSVKEYALRIPAGTAQKFLEDYRALPVEARANYKHHRVKKGDTLGAIARKYNVRMQDVVALNQLKNPRMLSLGQDLILPLNKKFSRLPKRELADDYKRSRRKIYRVRSGDSLWSIARKFNVTEKQLRVWNRLGWSNTIRPGQVLAVSKKGVRPPRKKVAKYTGPTKKMIYQVKDGDTLWGISRAYRVATDQIRRWNNLKADHILRPGQKLTLQVPVGHRG